MEAQVSSETSVLSEAPRSNIPVDGILHSYRREKRRSYKDVYRFVGKKFLNRFLIIECELRITYIFWDVALSSVLKVN
jgi:hypothetical protein